MIARVSDLNQGGSVDEILDPYEHSARIFQGVGAEFIFKSELECSAHRCGAWLRKARPLNIDIKRLVSLGGARLIDLSAVLQAGRIGCPRPLSAMMYT